MEPGTEIVFRRPSHAADGKLRYLIEIDGRRVDPLLVAHSTVRVRVEAGTHVLRVYAGRTHCFEATVDVSSGQARELDVVSRNRWRAGVTANLSPMLVSVRRPPLLRDADTGETLPGRVVRGRFGR